MLRLSSPLALKLNTNAVILLAVFILTLYITSCEARQLHVHGKHSSKLPSSPPKGVSIGVGSTKKETSPSMEVPVGSSMDASTGRQMVAAVKKDVAPSGDSRGSLRKTMEGTKARSGMRERPTPALGAESNMNGEQVGSNQTMAYDAETLVAMDYLDAHPAPAVHNR